MLSRGFILISTFVLGSLCSFDFGSESLGQLLAAKRSSDLVKRSPFVELQNAATLRYIDENVNEGEVFYSDVHVTNDKPFLVLEDIEHLLYQIECSTSAIVLRFPSSNGFENSKETCKALKHSLVVTSHEQCNDQGARNVFRVSDIVFNEQSRSISLAGSASHFHDAFDSLKVGFGHTSERHTMRLARRQTATTVLKTISTVNTALIPAATATTGPSVVSLSSGPHLDTTFPSDLTGLPLAVGCNNCSTTGSLSFARGEFDFDKYGIWDLRYNNATRNQTNKRYLDNGNVTLELRGFSAHLDLWGQPAAGDEFNADPFSFPLYGYTLPRIGRLGLMFVPRFHFKWEVSGGIRISYGLDIQVPDTRIFLDLADQNNTAVTGIEGTTITSLPFRADVGKVNLDLTVAFRPQISFGFRMEKNFGEPIGVVSAQAEAGVYLDLPSANLSIATISSEDHNAKCEAREPDSSVSEPEQTVLAAFPDMVHIKAFGQIGAGVDVLAELDLPGTKYDTDIPASKTIMSKATALGTTCLVWRSAPSASATAAGFGDSRAAAPTGSFAEATAVVAAVSAGESVTGGSAAVRVPGWTSASMLAAVVAIAIAAVVL